MNRLEFMGALEHLLSDIAAEERKEALSFYEDYFADAGPDQEERIILELGSPERIAGTIKADISYAKSNQERGEYTERGYQDTAYEENRYEVAGVSNELEAAQESGNYEDAEYREIEIERAIKENYGHKEEQASQTNTAYQGNPQYQNTSYNAQSEQTFYRQTEPQPEYRRPEPSVQTKPWTFGRVLLWIVLTIFVIIPIGIPLAAAAFSVFIAIVSVVFALLLAFGGMGIGFFVGGLGMLVIGVIKIFTIPWFGVFFIGGGSVLFGLGILFSLLTIFLATKPLPWLCHGFATLCRLPFRKNMQKQKGVEA